MKMKNLKSKLIKSIVLTGVLFFSMQLQAATTTYTEAKLKIVITPDNFPIIWYSYQEYGVDFTFDAVQVIACNTGECAAFSEYLIAAGGNGSLAGYSYRSYQLNPYTDVRAIYDANGKIVGVIDVVPLSGNNANDCSVDSSVQSSILDDYIVGETKITSKVSPLGVSEFSVPISLPPAITNMLPNLSITYNSNGSNGYLGQGASISGLPVISRCRASIFIDGYKGNINFDGNDRFCLNGQRLIAVAGPYGGNGTEYRTTIDSFSRVFSRGQLGSGPEYFEVETKSGRTMFFGNTPDSAIEASGRVEIKKWALKKDVDISNNYIEYVYAEAGNSATDCTVANLQIGESLPCRIDYTANDSVLQTAFASVHFNYEEDTNVRTGYVGDTLETRSKRINSIRTYSNGSWVKNYRMTYKENPANNKSQLTDIQECDGSTLGQCKRPIHLNWSEGCTQPVAKHKTQIVHNKDWMTGYKSLSGDFNGDGYTDIIRVGSINSYFCAGPGVSSTDNCVSISSDDWINNYIIKQGDFNGDGAADLYLIGENNSQFCSGLNLSTGSGCVQTIAGSWGQFYDVISGDFNSDGYTDLIFGGATKLFCSGPTNAVTKNCRPMVGDIAWTNSTTVHVGDFNGDGYDDFLLANTASSSYVCKGELFMQYNPNACTALANWNQESVGRNVVIGDYNGDGYDDVYLLGDTGSYFCAGPNIAKQNNCVQKIYNENLLTDTKVYKGDFNGDGRLDMYLASSNKHSLCDANTLINGGSCIDVTPNIEIEPSLRYAINILPGDYDGDGKIDLYLLGKQASYFSEGPENSKNITKITDSLGNTTEFTYKPLSDTSVYTKYASANYLYELDVQYPMQVVASKSNSNALGGENIYTYHYAGAKLNRTRGFLGFAQQTITDLQTNLTTVTDYNQQHPYIGMPSAQTVTKFGGAKLSQSTFNYLLHNVQSDQVNNGATDTATFYPYLNTFEIKTYDLDSAALIKTTTTTTLFDDFGNLTNKVISTIDNATNEAYTTATTNYYSHKASLNWKIKKLLTKSEASQSGSNGLSAILTTDYEYDNGSPVIGRLTKETIGKGTVNELAKTYAYGNFGNRKSETTSGYGIASRTTTTASSANGQFLASIKNAMDHQEVQDYEPQFGNLTNRTGPNGLTTTYEYDSYGRETAVQTQNGVRTETAREWCNSGLGHVCSVPAITISYSAQNVSYIVTTRQKGGVGLVEFTPPIKLYFDQYDREVRRESISFDGSSIYIDTNYDALGRVAAKTQPYFSTSSIEKNPEQYTYDVLGRINQSTSVTGTVVAINYSGLTTTTTTSVTNPSRVEIKVDTYNAIGQLISTQDNALQTLRFGYDANGNRTTTTDPSGNVITIAYDDFGRKIWMDDPDMGRWDYTYNALGELTSQKDAKNQITSMQYDVLGRMTSRNDHDGLVSEWHYNDNLKIGNTTRNKAISKLDYTTSSNGYQKDLYYDNFGRVAYSTVNIAGTNYRTDTTYDEYSRLDKITYPESIGRFEVKHVYQNGFLHKVTSIDGALSYWQADFRRANGQVQSDHYGNNIQIMRDFDAGGRTTWLNMGDATSVYEAYYAYDSIGNVTQRKTQRDQGAATVLMEDYTYDNLNRLTGVNINGMGNVTTQYDGLGNITNKSGMGAYAYSVNKPHAVELVAGNTYVYDANGNISNGAGRTVTWSSYNKPSKIENLEAVSDFSYGPERARFRHTDKDKTANTTQVTDYVGDLFEKVVNGTLTEYKHTIRAAGETIALHTTRSNSITTTEYLLKDTQGSVVAATDETGAVTAHFDYDAFGSRRAMLGESFISEFISSLPRGYTGHEHLDKLGLIHMNGRVYDPEIARFLSADPIVQAPNNLQSLNRYSYVMNNPMKFTDPSGFSWWSKHVTDPISDALDNAAEWLGDKGLEEGEIGTSVPFDTGSGSGGSYDGGGSGSGGSYSGGNQVDDISQGGGGNYAFLNIHSGDVTDYDFNGDYSSGSLLEFSTSVNSALNNLRGYEGFSSMEAEAGMFTITYDLSRDTQYNPKNNTINMNPNIMTLDYLTVLPPKIDSRFNDLKIRDRYIENYPEYHPFSLERVIFHEAVHSTQNSSGLRYTLNPLRYESPAISRTNEFMYRNFNEPYRRDHNSVRSR